MGLKESILACVFLSIYLILVGFLAKVDFEPVEPVLRCMACLK